MPNTNANSKYALFDFCTPRRDSVIKNWAASERLSGADRATLNQRLKRLTQIDFALAIGTKLLNGPLKKEIFKLKAYRQVMMRPMLCRGPVDKEKEYTLLVGAVEKDNRLIPTSCLDDAATNRETLVKDPTRRIAHVCI